MRVAAIFDIHGNLPALEAVLQEIGRLRVDRLVVGGDVFLGPMPCETLAALEQVTVPVDFLQGNCEVSLLVQMAGSRGGGKLPQHAAEAVRWTAGRLGPSHEEWIASWPRTARVSISPLGEVLFCHATPRDENEIFTRVTPEARLLPIFEKLDVPVVICGHTHMQFDRTVGSTRVLNAGSVGMPFGEPGAYWALLDGDAQLRRTIYDLEQAAERIRRTDFPQAEQFARDVLEPRSEKDTLDLLSTVDLG